MMTDAWPRPLGNWAAIALRNSQNLAALTESEERLQSISNNTDAVIFMKDSNGRYLYANQRWHDLFHTNDSIIQGKTDADIFPLESAEAFSRNDQWVLQNGQSLEIEELVPQDGRPPYLPGGKIPAQEKLRRDLRRLRHRNRHHRAQAGRGGKGQARSPAPAGPEDGIGGPAGRRRGPRFQQHAGGDPRAMRRWP